MSIALSSVAAFTAALTAARSVTFEAYTLRPGAVRDALASAARSGAQVTVRLERDPIDDAGQTLHRENARAVAVLAAAGAQAALTLPGSAVCHMKAAVIDGVGWLDDRNWSGNGAETVLRDTDPGDVAMLARALGDAGAGATNPPADGVDPPGRLRTTKGPALTLEALMIATAGATPLAVESESFGTGSIYNALLARARLGFPTRLLVAGREANEVGISGERERRRLARLESLGVQVRTGRSSSNDLDEKLAVGGGGAWVGSANATYARGVAGDQRDWGLATRDPQLVDRLGAAFETNWQAATSPLRLGQ